VIVGTSKDEHAKLVDDVCVCVCVYSTVAEQRISSLKAQLHAYRKRRQVLHDAASLEILYYTLYCIVPSVL